MSEKRGESDNRDGGVEVVLPANLSEVGGSNPPSHKKFFLIFFVFLGFRSKRSALSAADPAYPI